VKADPIRRTFIVGAGASVARPASLPLFYELRRYLMDELELPPKVRPSAEQLAPEAFMRALGEGGLPLESWLTQTLGQGEPNAVHVVLATAIGKGDRVWTVNVDELIEAAADGALPVASYDDVTPGAEAVLLKPHGTVSRRRYIFRSDQVVRPLPPGWARRLVEDCAGSHVVVIGYAGLDVDLRLVLDEALTGASRITWFAIEKDRILLSQRLPVLSRHSDVFRGGAEPDTLSVAFLAWADEQGLSDAVTPELRSLVGIRGDRAPATLHGDRRLARAMLLERIGDRAAAREELKRMVVSWPPSRAAAAMARLRTIDLYGEAAWTKPLVAIAAGRFARVLPTRLRKRLDRVHVTLLGSHHGRHVEALHRARRAVDKHDPAILLGIAKAARFTGDLPSGIANATRAAQVARAASEVDVLAHGLFELAFAHMWAGDLRRARSVVRELYSGIDGLAGARWIAWAHWHQACLHLYDHRPKDAIGELTRAQSLFEVEALPAGRTAAITVQLTAHRMRDDAAQFERLHQGELASLRGSRGWTAYTDASINLELAEWARAHGQPQRAEELYRQVVDASPDEPVHRTFAMLGLAELDRAAGRDNTARAAEIREVLREHPMAYIDAHLTVTNFLAGRIDAASGLAHITAVIPDLATRTGTPPRDPADYCLGNHPELHEIYLP
jgi:tetratricopeptide (TPR) repeat protein